jgi:hypothetical protein
MELGDVPESWDNIAQSNIHVYMYFVILFSNEWGPSRSNGQVMSRSQAIEHHGLVGSRFGTSAQCFG